MRYLMIIKRTHFIPYIFSNGCLIVFSLILYQIQADKSFFCLFFTGMLRNIILVVFLTLINIVSNAEPIGSRNNGFVFSSDIVDLSIRFALGTAVTTISSWIVVSRFVMPYVPFNLLSRWGLFIIKSFAYEIVFDLFHYITHRFEHLPRFYRFHKEHHRYLHPSAITTFYHHPIDLFLTNLIPLVLTFVLLYAAGVQLDCLDFAMLETYKVNTEIAGHLGYKHKASSFPQFPWLPILLRIQLSTKDHDLHHSNPLYPCNYSKRFTLWDKMFGTYRQNQIHTNLDTK
jgi:sterol desaturase/sphingolipid hydroxylase (fatty acid hydroxylase superfamily)